MLIHEAIRKAQQAPSIVTRQGFGGRYFLLISRNTRDCIWVGSEGLAKPGYGWEPTVDDLLADDWDVTTVAGIEWPAEAPAHVQRVWTHFLTQHFL